MPFNCLIEDPPGVSNPERHPYCVTTSMACEGWRMFCLSVSLALHCCTLLKIAMLASLLGHPYLSSIYEPGYTSVCVRVSAAFIGTYRGEGRERRGHTTCKDQCVNAFWLQLPPNKISTSHRAHANTHPRVAKETTGPS
jgi:hypothetical protein